MSAGRWPLGPWALGALLGLALAAPAAAQGSPEGEQAKPKAAEPGPGEKGFKGGRVALKRDQGSAKELQAQLTAFMKRLAQDHPKLGQAAPAGQAEQPKDDGLSLPPARRPATPSPSKGDAAENLAYTSEAIGPHMDLCYYESPPGLQLLHCLQFDEDVSGGGSLLVDAFAVAEAVRAASPAAFQTLSTVPATFLKDHSRRDRPVLLSYQRPHLAVDPRDQRLTGVFWSPPFEGPLRGLPPDAVAAYYRAYRVLHDAIDAAPRWECRLRPGEMLVFNNRRMLHGRAAFESTAGGGRHLRGGYVNIDEFANSLNLLRRAFAHSEDGSSIALGNQDWATTPIELPRELEG